MEEFVNNFVTQRQHMIGDPLVLICSAVFLSIGWALLGLSHYIITLREVGTIRLFAGPISLLMGVLMVFLSLMGVTLFFGVTL